MRTWTTSLVVALLASAALASQTLTGDLLEIHYGSRGIWYDSTERIGVRTDLDGSGTWTEWVGNGSAQHVTAFEWTQGGATYTGFGNWITASWTTLSESDLSDGTWMVAEYEWSLEDLSIVKTERWAVDDTVVSIEFELTNDGSEDIEDLRMLLWLDGDQDAPTTLATALDTMDLDGDGFDDWVQAVGVSSGLTIGFGACEPEIQELGSSTTFSTDVDVELDDDGGAEHDRPINIRHTVASLLAGETVRYSFLMSLASSASLAQEGYQDSLLDCVVCDYDEDGYLAEDCGGTDCDDRDASVGDDCGEPGDGGAADGGAGDGGAGDGGTSDGGTSDGGTSDGGTSDGGAGDGGAGDGGAGDGGAGDGGTSDGGTSDGGTSDGGTSDGGTSDGGTSDGGTSDGGGDGGTSDGGTSDGGGDGEVKGEGCACSSAPGAGGGLSALGLLLVAGLRRRRAR